MFFQLNRLPCTFLRSLSDKLTYFPVLASLVLYLVSHASLPVLAAQITIPAFQFYVLESAPVQCPCLYRGLVSTSSQDHKVAIYLTDAQNLATAKSGGSFLYSQARSVPPPGTSQWHVDFGQLLPQTSSPDGIDQYGVIISNIQPFPITIDAVFHVVPREDLEAVVPSGGHVSVPFTRPCPCFFTFSFFFKQKRCYVGTLVVTNAGYQSYLSTGEIPHHPLARRYFYLGLDLRTDVNGHLPTPEMLHMILINVNHKSRPDVNVSILYNIAYQFPPVVWRCDPAPEAGGPIIIQGDYFGSLPSPPGLRVTLGTQDCGNPQVNLPQHKIRCDAPPGAGSDLDVTVHIAGLDSGQTGRSMFSYVPGLRAALLEATEPRPHHHYTQPDQANPDVHQHLLPQSDSDAEAIPPQSVPAYPSDVNSARLSNPSPPPALHPNPTEHSPTITAASLAARLSEAERAAIWDRRVDSLRDSGLLEPTTAVYEEPLGFVSYDLSPPVERERMAARLREQLDAIQFPAGCTGRRLILYRFALRMGLGAHLNFITLALRVALERNLTLVMDRPNSWLYWEECEDGWECLFEPISSCTPSDGEVVERCFSLCPRSTDVDPASKAWRHWVPPEYAHLGLRWFRAQLSRYVFRPRAAIMEGIADMKTRLELRPPIIGLHMRRRPEKFDEGELATYQLVLGPLLAPHAGKFGLLPPVSAYIEAVLAIANRTGIYRVYVASDYPFESDLAPYANSGLQFLYDRSERRDRDFHEADVDIVATLGSLWLLGECDHWVGTYTSAFGRFADALMTSRRARTMSASIDIPWVAYP